VSAPEEPRAGAEAGAEDGCGECGGSGWVPVSEAPGAAVRRCGCFARREARRRLRDAGIPPRYAGVDLGNFHLYKGIDGTLQEAKQIAERFVAAFPVVDAGLLFEGDAGVGKTHLAVAILRHVMTHHGVTGRFVDYRDLLRSIQDSYNPVSEASELQILRPVLRADVLLLDELGTRRPTDWVRDTVTQILNDRYRHRRLTLMTTNYGDDDTDPSASTLADRIGPYARSRLYEMCRLVPMRGKDFRRIAGSGSVRATADKPFIAAKQASSAT
jgi:DNA replication protein DnaC